MAEDDNEPWLLDIGQEIIERKVAAGDAELSTIERLIYCLWVADYGMRNAGDLTTAADLHPDFLEDGRSAALELGLFSTTAAFSMSSQELEKHYFDMFEEVASEVRDNWTSRPA